MDYELGGGAPVVVTVTTTSTVISTPQVRRKKLIITNNGPTTAYLARSLSAVVNSGIPLPMAATLIDEPDTLGRMYTGVWTAISSGTITLAISEDR